MKIFIGFILTCLSYSSYASTTEYHFFVQFRNKGLNYVDINQPELFLSQRAIERRQRLNIPIDSFDLPVTASYIFNITKPSIRVRYVSKWLNGAVISTESMDSAWRLKIKFFVEDVVYLGKSTENENKKGSQSEKDSDALKAQYGDGYRQLEMLHGITLHQHGFNGEGMWVAIFDAGFRKVNELSLFDQLMRNNQIIYTQDIVDQESNVYDDDDHGLHVFGCMAANKPGTMIGSAPAAKYVLLRTESNKYEIWLEELNWVRAAEIADSLGVDVINSSLGYNTFDESRLDHKHADLDGKTTYISRGASMAATRGMLIVNSAGNDGNKSWGKLDFPADVENILVVGAINLSYEAPAFSSPGPTADYRIKPDVSALGQNTYVATTFGVGTGNGTSYSSPIIAGLATCLWQANPTLTPVEIKRIIIQSSHLSLRPDNALGHGMPDFNLALMMTGNHPTFDYGVSQIINFDSTQFSHSENVSVYFPEAKLGLCDVKLKKRFLFFKYIKTRNTFATSIDSKGFGKLEVQIYNLPKNKPVTLEFYYKSSTGRRIILKTMNGTIK